MRGATLDARDTTPQPFSEILGMLQDFPAVSVEDRGVPTWQTRRLLERGIRNARCILGQWSHDRSGRGYSIAIYDRNGVWWVAEFQGGRGELNYPGAWFRFHAGGLRYCHNRRTALHPSTPLTSEMLKKIERLHRESEAGQAKMLAAPLGLAAAAQRYSLSLVAWLRGLPPKTSRTHV
ncbi:MAG: hypothetical protein ACREYB_04475 [Casimicrobiaceae bacterium]